MPINYREDPTYYNHVCKKVMGGAPICHVFTSLSRDVVMVYGFYSYVWGNHLSKVYLVGDLWSHFWKRLTKVNGNVVHEDRGCNRLLIIGVCHLNCTTCPLPPWAFCVCVTGVCVDASCIQVEWSFKNSKVQYFVHMSFRMRLTACLAGSKLWCFGV